MGTDTTCWAGGVECKPGMPANTAEGRVMAEGRGARAGMTGLGRATADVLGKTGTAEGGVECLGKDGAKAGVGADVPLEHWACVGVPTGNLTVARAEPRADALVVTGVGTGAGVLLNLGEAAMRVGIPETGDVRLPGWAARNLGRADTTLAGLGNGEPSPGVPASWTGMTLGVVASTGEPTAGVHATTGEFMAGTPGSLAGGDRGNAGARGTTIAGPAPWCGSAAAVVVVALVLGTCGAGLEMMRTWLPGPRPWGGTTKRVLLRRICVPAARGVVVLMTILCWTVPVQEEVVAERGFVVPATLAGFTKEAGVRVLVAVRWEDDMTGAGSVPVLLWKFGD